MCIQSCSYTSNLCCTIVHKPGPVWCMWVKYDMKHSCNYAVRFETRTQPQLPSPHWMSDKKTYYPKREAAIKEESTIKCWNLWKENHNLEAAVLLNRDEMFTINIKQLLDLRPVMTTCGMKRKKLILNSRRVHDPNGMIIDETNNSIWNFKFSLCAMNH